MHEGASKEYKEFYQKLKKQLTVSKLFSIDKMRESFETVMKDYPPPQDIDFESISIGKIPALWTLSKGAEKKRILLFFHGGGFIFGSNHSYKGLMGRLSKASGHALLSIDYRQAPEHPYPAALEDALSSYHFLLQNHYAPNQIIMAGDSCGAGLLLSCMLKLKEDNVPLPAAAICICPWVDLAKINYKRTSDFLDPIQVTLAARAYGRWNNLKDPLISPLFGNLENLPPLFIQTGTEEIFYDQILQLEEKAKASGVKVTLEKWKVMMHVWHLFAPHFPEAQDAIDHIGSFIKQVFR